MKVEIYLSPKEGACGNVTWGALIGQQHKQPFCVIICLNWPYEWLLHGAPLLVNYNHSFCY
jgi:hypothetical protein